MMDVKETLKKLHKKFPMMGLDELFDVLDCYVEELTFSFKPEDRKLWSEQPNPWNTVTFNTVKSDPNYNLTTSCTDGKLKYYDGGGSTQFVADH